MIQKIRLLVQILFFGIFILLMFINKAQLWMGFIFVSVILDFFFGRIYCGWACPINTLIRSVNWIKKKLKIKNKPVPGILKSEKPRWAAFIFFLIGLGYTIYTITQGRKFPLPLIIIPLGLFTTFFISENAWHRYLCPWGVLFSLTARFSKFGISPSKCSSCSTCAKNCPADAITFEKKKSATVTATHCLLCFQCKTTCPINTMSYGHKK
ncbi:4Fe-4S binding protein [Clostridium magnum]|uniref:Putative electron transport protein YccM n=1 Tax=Clostridium magnum DSM 2767 TaxID=1121326 RepID=A0A161WZQ5_9CLOT|nr:4Fe-4S binding protein [Clostridium magnum]KZL92648.1 putative electron transport protein YccM [Clostridium magnum DSM 2767]SHI24160.1 4Fe-4S binding domain-containing protein [Clostridium magnum DSM 2767]